MMFLFVNVVSLAAGGDQGLHFLSPVVLSRPSIFYSDPLQAQAAAQAEADMNMESEVAARTEVTEEPEPPHFTFPHLHVQKATRTKVHASAKDSKFAHRDVSDDSCEALKSEIGALKCHMTSYITGHPEGCECHLLKPCPPFPADLGFTDLSEGATSLLPRMGDAKISLCMYWNWEKHDWAIPPDEALKADSIERVKKLWQTAVDQANASAAVIGKRLRVLMPNYPPASPQNMGGGSESGSNAGGSNTDSNVNPPPDAVPTGPD